MMYLSKRMMEKGMDALYGGRRQRNRQQNRTQKIIHKLRKEMQYAT